MEIVMQSLNRQQEAMDRQQETMNRQHMLIDDLQKELAAHKLGQNNELHDLRKQILELKRKFT